MSADRIRLLKRISVAAASVVAVHAWAHAGHHHGLQAREVAGWWTFDPLVVASLVISSVWYALGVRAQWARAGVGKGLKRWEVACFALGELSLVVALLSPLKALSDLLFSAHMSQHEILMIVAAPLLVLGRPLLAFLWAFGPERRERLGAWTQRPGVQRTWRAITGPFVVLVAHAIALWIWHVPALFEAALRNDGIHAFQHLCFFVTAAFFWWALIHGRYGKAGYGVAVVYVFATASHTGVLGALLTVARHLWYPLYADRSSSVGVNPLEDQQLAGLIMWVPAGVIFVVVGLALFAAWLGESERRVSLGRTEALLSGPPPSPEEKP